MLWCVACVAHIAHTYMQTYRSNQNVASEFSLKMCGEPLRCSSPVKPCPLAMRKGRETVGLVTADLYTVTTSDRVWWSECVWARFCLRWAKCTVMGGQHTHENVHSGRS